MTRLYKERYKDLVVDKIVEVATQDGVVRQIELYGAKLNGEHTWLLVHVADNCETTREGFEDA